MTTAPYPDMDMFVGPDLAPHDTECEVAARARGQQYWPDWRSCQCKDRRLTRSKNLDERPVDWTWLYGPRREDEK